MKSRFPTAFSALLAGIASGQTNSQHFDVLRTLDGRSFTTIIRATPAYAVVDFPSGGANVPFTNLPPEIQNFYHYDPANAARFLNDTAARRRAHTMTPQQDAAWRVAVAKLTLGPSKHVRMIKATPDGFVQVLVDGVKSEAFIPELPSDILPLIREFTAAAQATFGAHPLYGDLHRSDMAEQRFAPRSCIIARPTEFFVAPGIRQWKFEAMDNPNRPWF